MTNSVSKTLIIKMFRSGYRPFTGDGRSIRPTQAIKADIWAKPIDINKNYNFEYLWYVAEETYFPYAFWIGERPFDCNGNPLSMKNLYELKNIQIDWDFEREKNYPNELENDIKEVLYLWDIDSIKNLHN